MAGGVKDAKAGEQMNQKFHRQISVLTRRQFSQNDDRSAMTLEWCCSTELARRIAMAPPAVRLGGVICLGGSDGSRTYADGCPDVYHPRRCQS